MRKTIIASLVFLIVSITTKAQDFKSNEHQFDPPWQQTSLNGKNFTIYGIDNMPDFHGDVNDPDLVIFFAGNQYMVVPELLDAFKKKYPKYTKVFAETIPPGIEVEQIQNGKLLVGNMRITLSPDVITAGKASITEKNNQGWFVNTKAYAKNKLAIMVYKGNPKKISTLKDLGKENITVAMPNPNWEGIGKRIVLAYKNVGKDSLSNLIMDKKVNVKTTLLTTIHHRETPLFIMNKRVDAGPVWYSEAYYHSNLTNHPIDMVEIPDKYNVDATYMAGELKNAPHKKAAKKFMKFLGSKEAHELYKKYGFSSPF